MKFTKTDLNKQAKSYGYSVKYAEGEIEAYPKNMRGNASFFETDDENGRIAILATIKADFSQRFASRLGYIDLPNDFKNALQQWHDYHRAAWGEMLQLAWMYGRYDGFSTTDIASTLQSLRNSQSGFATLKLLKA